MRRSGCLRWFIMTAACCAIAVSVEAAQAAAACQPPIATIISVQGSVEVRRVGQGAWEVARLNDTYCPGDRIKVGERSRADLSLARQPIIRLDQNSTITLGGVREERTVLLELVQGALHFFIRQPRALEVNTAFVTAGVRGTEGLVRVEADRAQVLIFEGEAVAQNASGSVTLTDGEGATAERGRAPTKQAIVRPRDAVQWALYYPPVVDFRDPALRSELQSGPTRESVDAYVKGDSTRALELIKDVPQPSMTPAMLTYRAALLLEVGRVDAASRDLDQALRVNPKYAEALALESIIAVVQLDKAKATSRAQEALAADPASVSAAMALSYALQSNFDLKGALNAIKQAAKTHPDHALLWARLAELNMSVGDMKAALTAAKRAVEINPKLSRTQTVLGFSYLTRVEIKAAKQAFEKAIELDQADPLPRLGLGLALVRGGNLTEGRRQIEIAVSLDASNPIARSYVGKAYFEEKRTALAEREYAIAKELDPKDPTPWFYDAIAQETTNRPVAALQSLQTAIELNDNRAVYRSQLELESDLAARGASLGYVYNDLGFQPLALVEGWKSVNTDPTSSSAHRLLADMYSSQPRHEIARVSDLLQSQLLQPVGLTPIQPRLAESNLLLISAGGPGATALNEYNALFTRNQATVQASVLGGNNGTVGAEGIVSGLYDKFAVSLGGFYYQTDGWRTNSTQTDGIADAFLQYDLSPDTGLQFEYRYRDLKTGDLTLNFFQDDVRTQLENSARTETYRLGLRQALSPSSTLLLSVMHQDDKRHTHDTPDPSTEIDISEPSTHALSGELQHLYRGASFNTVAGVGQYHVSRDQVTGFNLGPGIFSSLDTLDASITHTNVYLYSYLNFIRNVTFTVGASGDFFSSDGNTASSVGPPLGPPSVFSSASRSTTQWNPKLGLTWNPVPDTTLRAAAFRVLKRSLISGQTLEPTQVAGFNQFFDDIEATDAWRYGVAVDQKFTRTLYGGIEVSRRDLKVPVPFLNPFTGSTEIRNVNWHENTGRPYLFYAPRDWLALSAEYLYERFERTPDFGFGLESATTHRVPLGVRVFLPSGFSLGLRSTYVHQSGQFQRRGGVCCESGTSDFWVTDLGLSYRLPNRMGFVFVGGTNIFNRNFQYQETDFNNPTLIPTRTAVARVSLTLP